MSDTFKCPICGETKGREDDSHMILIAATWPDFTVCAGCEPVAERLNQEFRESEVGIRSELAHAEMGLHLTRERLHKYVEEIEVLRAKLARLGGEGDE